LIDKYWLTVISARGLSVSTKQGTLVYFLSTSLQCSSYAGYRSNFLTAHQCVSVINLTIRLSVCHTQAL